HPERSRVLPATAARRVGRAEPLQPGDDVARARRIALVGEQRGDRLGVARLGGGGGGRRPVGSVAVVPGLRSTRNRSGGPVASRRSGPKGPPPGTTGPVGEWPACVAS